MIDRRRFLKCIAAAATAPALTLSCVTKTFASDTLQSDRRRILDLPPGFRYDIVSQLGQEMSDGLTVPGAHDGMAAFAAADGRVALICNHELGHFSRNHSAFGEYYPSLADETWARLYDQGEQLTPGPGGTTTTIYNPTSGKTERQFLSLGGTEINCAGGPTPWNSWLSCEECFETPGIEEERGDKIVREQRHGYVFEVAANAGGLVEAQPIKAMGRFQHEAAAVDERSGIVYLTEDRQHSLFYRYIPQQPGNLLAGGRLQALAINDRPSTMTHNWSDKPDIDGDAALAVHWLDLDNVDSADDDLRLRGAAKGAATFARGEGLCAAGDRFAFTCTNGGRARLGQVFTYKPSRYEGAANEQDCPGQLTLIAESDQDSLLHHADNLTMAPWGDLIVCEDDYTINGLSSLVGIRPDGSQYILANNAYSRSELAGACFSPDGKILFVNIQFPGMTIAIKGPWPT